VLARESRNITTNRHNDASIIDEIGCSKKRLGVGWSVECMAMRDKSWSLSLWPEKESSDEQSHEENY